MLMQNTLDGEIRDLDPAAIPPHKAYLWQSYTPPEPEHPSLDSYKESLCGSIDATAEQVRLRYITPGAGQALEYREVAEEAARYVATGGAGAYPMLQASVNAGESASLEAAASLVAQREAAWATLGALIREKRIAAKRAVMAAQNHAAALTASQVEWP